MFTCSTFDSSWLTRISSLNIQCPVPISIGNKPSKKRNLIILWRPLRLQCQSTSFPTVSRPIVSNLHCFPHLLAIPLQIWKFRSKIPSFTSVKIRIMLRNFTWNYSVWSLSKVRQNPLQECILFIFIGPWLKLNTWKAPVNGQFLPHN